MDCLAIYVMFSINCLLIFLPDKLGFDTMQSNYSLFCMQSSHMMFNLKLSKSRFEIVLKFSFQFIFKMIALDNKPHFW